MSNIDKAAVLIGQDLAEPLSERLADNLAEAGLLAPDLPKPELTHDFGYAHWDLRSERPVSAQSKRGSTHSSKVFLRMGETHIFDPDEARHLAYNLLAAAQWAEKELKL